jgi:hypothetical protein
MRAFFPVFALFLAAGCAPLFQSVPPAYLSVPPSRQPTNSVVYTPVIAVTGTIALVNESANYVVISLTPGLFPAADTILFNYRNGVKQGTLRVTGMQNDDKVVADIVRGNVQVNDLINDK